MAYRKKIIAGNWKMNKTASDARILVKDILLELGKFDECDVVLCPPFTALGAVSELLNDITTVRLGAQNLHQEKEGAYTGEISAAMLRDLYCRYVIIGHSERRHYFGETNELICRKIKAALEASLKPIVCVGETLEEHTSNRWKEVLEKQLRDGLAGLSPDDAHELTLAYEPVWAIGTGKTATPGHAQAAHQFVRGILTEIFGLPIAEKLRLQYGGSVKPDNAKDLLNQPDIDGALVGGASLDARSFIAIIKNGTAPEG